MGTAQIPGVQNRASVAYIRALMKERSMSRTQLADAAGMSYDTVKSILDLRRSLHVDQQDQIAEAFGMRYHVFAKAAHDFAAAARRAAAAQAGTEPYSATGALRRDEWDSVRLPDADVADLLAHKQSDPE